MIESKKTTLFRVLFAIRFETTADISVSWAGARKGECPNSEFDTKKASYMTSGLVEKGVRKNVFSQARFLFACRAFCLPVRAGLRHEKI